MIEAGPKLDPFGIFADEVRAHIVKQGGEVDTPIKECNGGLGVSFGIDEETGRPFLRAYTEAGFNNTKVDIIDILDYLKEHHPLLLTLWIMSMDII